jgi:hypothetical protein
VGGVRSDATLTKPTKAPSPLITEPKEEPLPVSDGMAGLAGPRREIGGPPLRLTRSMLPVLRLKRKTSFPEAPLTSFWATTRLVARLVNETQSPSALIPGSTERPFAAVTADSGTWLTRRLVPSIRSWRKTERRAPEPAKPATRSVAWLE